MAEIIEFEDDEVNRELHRLTKKMSALDTRDKDDMAVFLDCMERLQALTDAFVNRTRAQAWAREEGWQ